MRDERYIAEKIDFIEGYKGVGNSDFSQIDRLKERINNETKYRQLIVDMNREIDRDFVKENEEIENLAIPEYKEMSDFLKDPNTKIIEGNIPVSVLWAFDGLSGEALMEKKKEMYSQVKLIASNSVLKKSMPLSYSAHLFALRKLFKEARADRRKERRTGKRELLHHYDILETNELLFEGTKQEGMVATGAYRSPYTGGLTLVDGKGTQPVGDGRVADYMDAILDWYNGENAAKLHPIERAMILHTEILRVHPFGDGNGRTARLILNYDLIKSGYPSIVIKAIDKPKYLSALQQALNNHDIGDLVHLASGYMLSAEKKYIEAIKVVKTFEKKQK